MERDALLEEVREARREISAECGHDIWKLFDHYVAMQNELRESGKYSFISSPNAAISADNKTTPSSLPR